MEALKKQITETYKKIKADGLVQKTLPLKFSEHGKKRGGFVSSLRGGDGVLTPYVMSIDFLSSYEPTYILLHEVAHQICIEQSNNPRHDGQFKKTLNKLIKVYGY